MCVWRCNILKISITSNCSVLFFRISVALLIFCLEDLPIDVSTVLKSSTITVLLPVSGLWQLVFVSCIQFRSVAQSCPTLCDPMNCSMPGLSITNYPNPCPSSQWCHPAISSSFVPFSSCSQSLPTSGSFPVSQLFTWGGQSIGVSASASVLSMNTQDWSPLGWTNWISLQSKGLSRVFSNTTVQKHQFFGTQRSSQSQLSHPYMTTGKTIALTGLTFVGKVMSLLFNILSRLVITFLPRSKFLLISWLQSPSAVILEPPKIKFPLFPNLLAMKWWDQMPWS